MTTLANIIERINSETGNDSNGGFDCRNAETQAVEYAVDAWDADYDYAEQIEYHLSVLIENGAQFDADKALRIAKLQKPQVI